MSALGIGIGLAAGYGLTWAAAGALAESLPVPPRLGFYPAPLALAALYGLLTALAFALWPLGRAARISGAALFRDVVQPAGAFPGRGVLAANALAAAALVALIVLTARGAGLRARLLRRRGRVPAAVPLRRGRADGGWRGGSGTCGGRRCGWGWPTCTGRARRRPCWWCRSASA